MSSLLDNLDDLVEPTFYVCPPHVETLGPEVAEFGVLCGRTPNPEQRMLLDGGFGIDKRGRLVPFEIVIVGARQNLKTGFLEFQALGKAVLLKRPLQIWTAHKETATDAAFLDFMHMIEASSELSRRIKRVTQGKGSKEIEFTNRSRIVFRPRTGKAGQALTADDIDLDETFAVEPKHLGSLMPTLSTRPNAQVTYASSAPHPESAYLRALMARGRAAANGDSTEPRLLYAEWSVQRLLGVTVEGRPRYGPPPCENEDCSHKPGVSEGCIADDRELIKLANPSVGRSTSPSISWEFISDERRALAGALEEYFRERLGAGDEGAGSSAGTVFGIERWESAGVDREPPPPAAIGIAVSLDREWASIAAASVIKAADPEDPDGPPIDKLLVGAVDRREGVDWLPAEVKRIQDTYECGVVIDEKGPTADVLRDLEAAEVTVDAVTLDQYAGACSRFYDKVRNGTLLHLKSAELDVAVVGAEWRFASDRRVWGRKQSTRDVSMLEAATLAAHGADLVGSRSIYEDRGVLLL